MSCKKHLATVLERICLPGNNYMFTYSHIVTGLYDEKSKTFIDEYGNDYYYMLTKEALSTDVDVAVYNIVEIDELKKKSTNDALEVICFDYQTETELLAYYVGLTDKYEPFVAVLNIDNIRKAATNVINGNKTSPVISEQGASQAEELENLILDTVEGKYKTVEELEDKIEELSFIKDLMTNTIGTMETKIEAIKANKTYREMLDENIANYDKNSSVDSKKQNQERLKEDLKRKHQAKLEAKDMSVVVNPQVKDRINIEEVFKEVTKYLIAQDEPALRVITEIARKDLHPKKKKEAILLTGQTGSGKTYLMELIAKSIGRTFHIEDSTQITCAGYVGKDIEQVLWDVYVKSGKNKEKAEKAIIYFDEIDKKGSEKNDDVNAKAVLNALLKFIEGTAYDAQADTKGASQIVKLDTSNMTIIFGGAFADVYKNLTVNNTIGFDTEKNSVTAPKYREAEIKDFVENGMMTPEFMGRVTVIKLNDLTLDDLKRILLEGQDSAIRVQEAIFNKLGVKIKFTDGYIDSVTKKAFDKKTGARGLNGIVDESTWKVFREVYDNEGTYKEAILTEETVEDNSKYKLVKVKQKNKK